MTRKSKREIEQSIDRLDTTDRDPTRVVIQRDRVDTDGNVIETVKRDVIEL